jgi:nicotinamidase-related amidase
MIEDPKYAPPNLRAKMEADDWLVISSPKKQSFDYYRIKPEKGEKEFIKRQYDAFTNRGLQRYLREKDVSSLILTGVYTSRCVDSTMRSAFTRGYHCIVPEDLVAMPAQLTNEHQAALSVCRTIFGYVVKSDEIVDAWGSMIK